MILKQYYLGCLAHASYLIADPTSGTAVVVDPQRDIDQYVEDARVHGVRIEQAILTHFHADFVAGHLELRDRVGATIGLGARGRADYAFTALADGAVIDLGRVRLSILETPGHTPEGICLLVYDLDESAVVPHAVLTGDTLFIGDVGRPDLLASAGMSAAELASMLYDSLHGKLLQLPDETRVYPGHGAGSLCGKNLSTDTVSTIGAQRRYNYALQPMTREAFAAMVTADQPEAPAYFAHDVALNKAERPTLDETMSRGLTPLDLASVLALEAGGAQLLDVREPADFEGAHLTGAINIGLGGKFATWSGSLLDAGRPLVIVAEPGREQEAALRLGRVGLDRLAGYLDGGMMALAERADLVARTERITAESLRERLAGSERPVVLDVRNAKECMAGSIDGSINIPLSTLESRLAEVPRDRPLVVCCASGYRSAIAASLLERAGIADLADLVGGLAAWSGTATCAG